MIAKKQIVGFRVDDAELELIKQQVAREHLGYVSTLVRKATFWYIEFMNKPEGPPPARVPLNEGQPQ
jgi:hypothetical protein